MKQSRPRIDLAKILGAVAVVAALAIGSLGFVPATPSAPAHTSDAAATANRAELAQAQTLLDRLIVEHPILKGVTIEIGDADGHQGVAYPRAGRIVISPDHTALLTRIVAHEAGHILDYRDNGRIDWGENVPL